MDDKKSVISRFLQVASDAHEHATCEQRRAIRALASMNLTVEENIDGIEKIMGWT